MSSALALKSLNPIQLTASQQMLLTGVGSGQIKLSAGTQGNRKYHLDGGYKAGTGIRYFRLHLSRCRSGDEAVHRCAALRRPSSSIRATAPRRRWSPIRAGSASRS